MWNYLVNVYKFIIFTSNINDDYQMIMKGKIANTYKKYNFKSNNLMVCFNIKEKNKLWFNFTTIYKKVIII